MTTQNTSKVEPEDPLLPSERVALGTFLSDWDETLTFDEVLEQIQDEEDDSDNAPTIWEPFENYDKDDVVGWIQNLDGECSDLNDPVCIAAPELLAALKSLVGCVSEHKEHYEDTADWEDAQDRVETARAAIKKATNS
jgi:hypothetical protein